MDVFVNTLGVVAALVVGIIAFTLFVIATGWLGNASQSNLRALCAPRAIRVRGVLVENTRVVVHLANGTVFDDVLHVGSMSAAVSIKGDVPHSL